MVVQTVGAEPVLLQNRQQITFSTTLQNKAINRPLQQSRGYYLNKQQQHLQVNYSSTIISPDRE